MQSPREAPHFRWVRRPSEETLLGLAPVARRIRPGVLEPPAPMPQWTADRPPPASGPHLRTRHVVAAALFGLVAGLALHLGSDGLPFPSSRAQAPVATTEPTSARVPGDRDELADLPRDAATAEVKGGSKPTGGGRRSHEHGSSRPKDGSGPKPPPADESSEAPLLRATIPGVGTVTVEDPGSLPEEAPTVDEVLSTTTILELP